MITQSYLLYVALSSFIVCLLTAITLNIIYKTQFGILYAMVLSTINAIITFLLIMLISIFYIPSYAEIGIGVFLYSFFVNDLDYYKVEIVL